jgi:hypothetical protein
MLHSARSVFMYILDMSFWQWQNGSFGVRLEMRDENRYAYACGDAESYERQRLAAAEIVCVSAGRTRSRST